MTKYEKYNIDYENTISKGFEEHPSDEYIVRKELWICVKWLEDIKAEPFESDKIVKGISHLSQEQEFDLIELLGKGLRLITDALIGK